MRTLSDVVVQQKPLCLTQGATITEACKSMATNRAGSVLVTNQAGALCGILTGRDVVARVVAKGLDPRSTKLGAVMTTPAITIAPSKTPLDALRLMWAQDFRHLPVVENGRILGIVTRGDFSGLEQSLFDDERELWEHLR